MKAETIFSITSTIALLSWVILAVAPRWSWTRKIILSGAIPLLFSIAYLVLIIVFWGQADGNFSSLGGVMKLFTNEWAVLAGWIHYLAFDLFVGSWEVKDAQEKGVSHWLVLPCLFLTFMLGPIGFLLYYIIRLLAVKGENNE